MTVVEYRHDGWLELRLSRARQRNALSTALADSLIEAIQRAEGNYSAILLAADGPVFSAGADLKEQDRALATRPGRRIAEALLHSGLFVVTAVEGPVFGDGLLLIAASPFVISGRRTTFTLPEASFGYFPLGVAPWLEPHLPPRTIVELGLTGQPLDAVMAQRCGLVNRVLDDEVVHAEAEKMMVELVRTPELLRQAKYFWTRAVAPFSSARRLHRFESRLQ